MFFENCFKPGNRSQQNWPATRGISKERKTMKTKKVVAQKTKSVKPVTRKAEDTKAVTIQVAKDPENTSGLRGLRGMVFDEMSKAWKAKKDLPTMDQLTGLVAQKYPQSRWIARPKVHYSYYKSKFLQSVKA